ncbi:hypothetical protein KSS87_008723 [Heliosperma pusillum]|nr:hypothetical protein KSS87_022815 [Heliosperma pusillum]KAH9618566.1 hypothetical protein KSS87_008723 [Heliosperma pusillum]
MLSTTSSSSSSSLENKRDDTNFAKLSTKTIEAKMAAMAALQTSFTSLSISSNSFLGQRLFPCPILPQVRTTDQPPCLVSAKVGSLPPGYPPIVTKNCSHVPRIEWEKKLSSMCKRADQRSRVCQSAENQHGNLGMVFHRPHSLCDGLPGTLLKHWERKECKPNSLPIVHKMHVKVGDTIKVISGSEKGKIGEVTKLYKHNSTIIIKDVNLKTKHMKAKGEGEPGQIIKIEGPVHSSNVMLYSKEKEVTSRVGHKVLEDGSKVRYLIKTGEIIDSAEKWKEVMKNKKETEIAVAA